MKVKTSIKLSSELLKAIDRYMGAHKSRSDFLETAARNYIKWFKEMEAERRDLAIIDQCADTLNAEAEEGPGDPENWQTAYGVWAAAITPAKIPPVKGGKNNG